MWMVTGNIGGMHRIFKTLSYLCSSADAEINKDGIKVYVYPGHFMIGKDMFDSYECNRPIRVKLDVGKLAEFFKSNESADRLTISSNNSDLLINLVSTRKFKMKKP